MQPDYIIIGAGSAGSVLAERLSANGKHQVLLLEAGPSDKSLMVSMPKGFGKMLTDGHPRMWAVPAGDDSAPHEIWWRGRTLGGSSSVNGMVYLRGMPEDYERWEQSGAVGWGWSTFRMAFSEIDGRLEDGNLAMNPSAPVKLTISPRSELGDRVIAAGVAMGMPSLDLIRQPARHGIGYVPCNISKGRRVSAADAFLAPSRSRSNLAIRTDATVERIVFENRRAVGVRLADGSEIRTRGEVILCAGALHSPQILQRSGIGPKPLLDRLGIEVVADSANVGGNMVEHRLLSMHYRLRRPLGLNRSLRGMGAAISAARYLTTRSGPLASGACDVTAFIKTRPDLDQPDAQILMSPFGYSITAAGKPAVADFDSFSLFGHPLECKGQGSIEIASADPTTPAHIRPNYFADEHYREVAIAMFRFIRRLTQTAPLAEICGSEVFPGEAIQSDSEILQAFRNFGYCGLHACGTVRMGADRSEPVDLDLRVRGVDGLRVVDASVFPSEISSNPNGAVMALAWHAGSVILSRPGIAAAA